MTEKDDEQDDEDFDCVGFKRRVQAEIYEEIKDMTHEEELAYWRRSVEEGPLADWWRSLKPDSQVVRETPPNAVDDHELH